MWSVVSQSERGERPPLYNMHGGGETRLIRKSNNLKKEAGMIEEKDPKTKQPKKGITERR